MAVTETAMKHKPNKRVLSSTREFPSDQVYFLLFHQVLIAILCLTVGSPARGFLH